MCGLQPCRCCDQSCIPHTHINRNTREPIIAFLNLISPFLELVRELYCLSGTGRKDTRKDKDMGESE